MRNLITLGIILASSLQPASTAVLKADTERLPSPVTTMRETSISTTVWVTAYSSTPEQTDSTPFITASGTKVKDGIIAANFLPFGTKVKIPEHFGEKVFIVEDRMHARKKNFVDIWMPTTEKALAFGVKRTKIVLLATD